MQGETYLPNSALARPDIATGTRYGYSGLTGAKNSEFNLTDRQIEVLYYLAEGQTNKEIARSLCVSEATIKTHLSKIYRTLNISNRTEAARLALQMELPEKK